jgi:phosphoribosyl-dephospho-CoA transferase
MACADERAFTRHELVYIWPWAWASILTRQGAALLPYLTLWAARGWPLIVRRPAPGDESDHVPVGIPLPPASGKVRISLTVPVEAILTRAPPPPLVRVTAVAHAHWRPTLLSLARLGRRCGATPRAIGSLMWQHVTGLPYLSRTSDIDAIWLACATSDLKALLSGIYRIERQAPTRIDGEIAFPNGNAVQWRDLYRATDPGCAGEVLVKCSSGASLQRAEHILETWSKA